MAKLIITGATGFIGSHLCKRLVSQNHEVHIICRTESSLESLKEVEDRIKVYRHSSDIQALIHYFKTVNADGVFHLAALCMGPHEASDLADLVDSNIKFGLEILEAMKASGVKKIINTGTFWQHYKNEDYNPVSLYAATKQAFEDLLWFYIKAYDMKAITLKLFDTYGPDDRRNKLISQLKNTAYTGAQLLLSEGYQKLDFIHVDDVVDAYLCAWELLMKDESKAYECYGVGTGRVLTLREIVALFEQETKVKLNVSFGKRPYREREVMEPWSNYQTVPNWKSKISLEEGIKRFEVGVVIEGKGIR